MSDKHATLPTPPTITREVVNGGVKAKHSLTLVVKKVGKQSKDRPNAPYFALPELNPDNKNTILTFLGDETVCGELEPILNRTFQDLFFEQATDEKTGVFDLAKFISLVESYTSSVETYDSLQTAYDEMKDEIVRMTLGKDEEGNDKTYSEEFFLARTAELKLKMPPLKKRLDELTAVLQARAAKARASKEAKKALEAQTAEISAKAEADEMDAKS